MDNLVKRENQALNTNPNIFHYPSGSQINITTHGSDVYWAVTAVMAFSTFVILGHSFMIHRRNRIFHYITASITLVASVAYFTMASNLGYAAIMVEFQRSNPRVAGQYREIFYVRYIDWFVTTPLLLLDLMLTAGLPWPTIMYTLLLDEVMVVTGLVGALVASSYKWGYFVLAMMALFVIAWNVCFVGLKHAKALGSQIGKTYLICGVWTIFLWFLYPIAWGVSEGGNVIAPDSEAVFYGVLDILAKPIFGAILLVGHRNIDPAELGLHIRDYEDPVNRHPNNGNRNTSSDLEKSRVNNPGPANALNPGAVATPANGAGNGVIGTHANHDHVA